MKPIGYPYGATKAAMCLRPRVATLGSKLRDAIKRKRVRQKDVAQAVGVRPPTVSQWVNDIEKPGRDRLVMLANYLGTSVDELMKEDEFNDKGPLTQIEDPASLVRTEVRLAHIAEPYFRQMPQNVPVLGTGAGSQEGEFKLERRNIRVCQETARHRQCPTSLRDLGDWQLHVTLGLRRAN